MPPRKKAKASAASTPLTETQPKTPQESGSAAQSQDHELLLDPWADDQETQLFKSMMKWKPTGLHKHFRMISIHNDMRSHGFATEDAPHTRIAGIWRKLHQLYDLRALDERENSYEFSDLPDPLDREEATNMAEFELPEEDFGELMWQKRFHGPESEAASSPAMIPAEDDKLLFTPGVGLLKDLPDSVRSQRAESVTEATPTPKNTKNTRSRAATKSGKGAKGGQSAAKNSKAQSAVSESAEEEEDEEDEDEESSSESEEESAPTTRRTNRSNPKARPAAPKRTRKR